MRNIFTILFLLFTLSVSKVHAQIFPVQATTQLSPPYSLYLSDYVASGSERLVLNLFLGDIQRPQLDVRFRLRIVGQNVTIETKPEYMPPRVSLHGGVPLRLMNTDLAHYFHPNNLNFQGITKQQYERMGKLPEGVYQFCFEVLEYNRGVKISNTACAVAWMVLNDPPIINLPRQDEKIRPQLPQNMVFQWTPRHTGSPNSAFTTEYTFEMVEVWPENRNPNDAILTSPKILEATTQTTTFIYGPSEVQLEPGRRYAFRIRAKAQAGIDELDLFKNQGYSEVYTFMYGDACGLPSDVVAQPLSSSRVKFGWDVLAKHSLFNVRYREAGTTAWYINESTLNETIVNSLKPATVYEYQVSGICGSVRGEFSDIATVKTPEAPPSEYTCGLPIQTFDLDPSQLTGSLKVGDIVNAGDFDVSLTKVTGSNGVFTGEGVVVMPMMNKAKVKVDFKSITVATDPTDGANRMVKGDMNVVGGELDIVPQGVLNAIEKLDEILDIADSALTLVETYLPREGPDPASFAADTLITFDANIVAVVPNNETGKVYVTTSDGKVTEIPAGGNVAVADSKGKGYAIDKKGGITKTTAEEAVKASKREYNFAIQFANAQSSKFGFDTYDGRNVQLAFTYENLNDSYYVPWKAASQTTGDVVEATLSDASLNPEHIRFEMIGLSATATLTGNNKWNIQITSSTHAAKIIAYYQQPGEEKEQILGKLNVSAFDQKDLNLVIVKDDNVNVSLETIGAKLNEIYGQAIANWKVSYETRDLGIDKTFDAGGTSVLTNYTADMRKVISNWGTLQEDTYYMFVIEKPTNSGDVNAFMPRSRQAGFVYADGSSADAYAHTIAHELGHGAFALRHPFLEFPGLQQKATNNLMDYKGVGNHHLMHFQWERIHDPVTVIGLFDEDEEAQSVITTLSKKSSINGEGEFFAYLTPSGQRIILTKNQYPIFYHGIANDQYNDVIPGVLIGFRDAPLPGKEIFSGDLHWATFSGNDFIGYEDFIYFKPIDIKDDNSIILGLPTGEKNESNFALYKFEAPNNIQEFSTGAQPILSVTSSDFKSFGFFGSRKPDLTNTDYRKADNLLGENQIAITTFEGQIIEGKFVDISQFLNPTLLIKGYFNVTHQEKPEIFLIIKIAEYFNRYPVFFEEHSSWFDSWNLLAALRYPEGLASALPGADAITKIFSRYSDKGTWDEQNVTLQNIQDKNSLYNKWLDNVASSNDAAYDFYKEFLTNLQVQTKDGAKNNIECLKNLINLTSTEDIYHCLVRASEDEIAKKGVISAEARLYAIKKLLNQFWVDGESEELIVKLIKYAPSDFDADDFIDKLENECSVMVRVYPGIEFSPGANATYEETICLWEILFEKVNDGDFLFSGDYRKEIVDALTKLYYKSNRFLLDAIEYNESIQDLDIEIVEPRRYEFTYDYQGIFRRLWSDTKLYYNPYVGSPEDFYSSLKVNVQNINTGGRSSSLVINQEVKRGFFFSTTQYKQLLSPFDLVFFTNKSKQDLLSDYSPNEIVPVPALALYYASEVGNKQTASDIVQTGVDVATLLIPGGQLSHLTKLGRYLYYADKISSVASMGGTAFRDHNPEVAGVLNAVSLSTGIASLGNLAKGTSVKNVQKTGDLLTRNSGSVVSQSLILSDEVVKLKNANQVQALTRDQALLTKEVLEKDKHVLSGLGHLDAGQIRRYENSIQILDEVIGGLKTPLLNAFSEYKKLSAWISKMDDVEDAYLLGKLDDLRKLGETDPSILAKLDADIDILGSTFKGKPDLIESWIALIEFKLKSYVKTDIDRLNVFHSLSAENKKLIRQFTDVDAKSTLSKFLDDCDADSDFLNYINNPDNALEVKGFLAHKEGILTLDENRLLSEMLENSDEIPNSYVRKWLEYGDNMAIFKANREAGNAFTNLIKTQLGDVTSEAYLALKKKVPNLDDYSIYSQVQLCLKDDCISKGNYWIPDFILLAVRTDVVTRTKYLEVIIVDAKLSGSTGWTPNQNVAKGMSEWEVKSIGNKSLVKGSNIESFEEGISIMKKEEFIKLYNEGGTLKTN